MHGLVTPVAALFETTKGYRNIATKIVVDTHGSYTDRSSHLVGGIDVVAPHGTGQAKNRVICNANGLIGGLEGQY